jgi:Fe-S-cluster-containing dehydrogenase component
MRLDRRSMMKGALAGGAAAVASAALPAPAHARARRLPDAEDVGLLYDATLCIGCKACVVGCREANGMKPESSTGLWDDPTDLSGSTRNVIRVYREGEESSFFKAQCLHCTDPACVSACMLGALHKSKWGIVAYDKDSCIGCRICQVACPFNVPKFQWASATPQIVKCELCRHRLAEGKEPGCTAVCPTKAVIFGKRSELLAEAKRRLAAQPERYFPKIYGETDAGGTAVLYLSAVPFEKVGLPALGDEAAPALSETIQHGIYKGFAAPLALYALLAGVMVRNRRKQGEGESEEEPS